MSFNLGSEPKLFILRGLDSLAPMSFNLGSELGYDLIKGELGLAPMSFNLGSEPLFSNLYLIVT